MADAFAPATFEASVKLREVEVQTGEEGEAVLYKHRSRLYRFDSAANEWKERGTGDVKLLYHPESKKIRILLREEKTMKLRMNHSIIPGLELKPNMGSDRAWQWACTDYADPEPVVQTFAIKFKDAEVANAFKAKYIEAQEIAEGKRAPPAIESLAKADEDSKRGNPWDRIIHDGKLVGGLPEEALLELWNKYDRDGSKSLDASEIENLLGDLVRAIVKANKDPLPEGFEDGLLAQMKDVAEKVLKHLDVDADGKVTWGEFAALNDVSLV